MKHFGVTDPRLEDYMEALLPARGGVLSDMEAHAEREGVGIIGPMQGQFLYTLVLALKPKDILEVGTAIGYSAIWLSMAAEKVEGRVVTLERDNSRAVWAEAYMRQAGLSGVCAVRRGDAFVLMRGMEESFDLIFLDVLTQFDRADTSLEMLDLCVRRLRPGGVLLSDNALRSGQVLQPQDHSPSTQGIAAFNQAIFNHPRLTSTIIPIRDGLSMSVKAF
ncbi:MAG: O-methyltransferase [Chloroflexota bacterium]|nr:O-methyltransferase [Chloroflexota bacterium]MDQ5865454.1 O-methyltransferase [Chloroflexota bacterium]